MCGMLVNGFASGDIQYIDLAPHSVNVRIRWEVKQGEQEETFAGQFTPRVNETGTTDAGNGSLFSWSFARQESSDITRTIR